MQAKVKVFIQSVSQIEVFEKDDKKTRVAVIKVMEPARTDDFNEKVGKDQTHEVRAINKAIDQLPMEIIETISTKPWTGNLKAELNVYINSKTFEWEGKEKTAIEISLAKITIVD